MPELPEVETVRRDLEAELVGATITAVEATGVRSVRRHGDDGARALRERLPGRRLVAADRRGKYLLLRLDSPDAVVVHLGMSGQLRVLPSDAAVAAHTHVTWRFDGGRELRFVDPRTFGEVFVVADRPGDVPLELAHLGPDALLGLPDAAALGRRLAGRRRRIKPVLLDQRVIAGIGNLYADEILWAARISPDRPAGEVGPAARRRLHAAIGETLAAAITARGSSLADEQYRDLHGAVGTYQAQHHVYAREDRPCPRCGRPIRRARDGGRSTFSCSRCQR